jgi:hypothetical protein
MNRSTSLSPFVVLTRFAAAFAIHKPRLTRINTIRFVAPA